MVMRITARERTWISEVGSTAVLMLVVVMGIKNKRGVDEKSNDLVYDRCWEKKRELKVCKKAELLFEVNTKRQRGAREKGTRKGASRRQETLSHNHHMHFCTSRHLRHYILFTKFCTYTYPAHIHNTFDSLCVAAAAAQKARALDVCVCVCVCRTRPNFDLLLFLDD